MIVEKCPYLFKVGNGENCYRCNNKLSHTHECSFNNPKRDHTHKIEGEILKYHAVPDGFSVFKFKEGKGWIFLES
jgi:hypothetical protein